MIDIGAIVVTSSAIARKSPRIAGSFNAICITGITGLLITNAGSLNTDIAICSGIWIAFTIAMEMAIVIVIGSVTMMAVIGNGGRIRQMIGWERTWQFYHPDCRKLATEMGTMGHFGSTANQPTVNRQT
jgi:hypothetical protein